MAQKMFLMTGATGATHRVGDRPNRFEPRAKKQRRNHYDWLTKPRAEIKRKMAKGFTKI
jgi:hypothetical protein